MAINKTKKQQIIQTLSEALKEAKTVVFARFFGLSVSETSAIRKALRDENIGYYVAKKTLIARSLNEHGYKGELSELPGKIAVVWSDEDEIAPARAIREQGAKKKDTLFIEGGVFNGAYVDAAYMQSLSIIPSMPVLRGMFVNVINSPIAGLVIALDQIRAAKA